jgi:hypothetical protein
VNDSDRSNIDAAFKRKKEVNLQAISSLRNTNTHGLL